MSLPDAIGGLRVDALLGEGSMGRVYQCTDTGLGRQVAVKTLYPHLLDDAVMRERFLREARALARVKSAHVVTVHAIGEDAALGPFVVMERLVGEDLLSRLRHGPLELDDLVAVARGVALGLKDAHAAGLLHRDIKPANLFFCAAAAAATSSSPTSAWPRTGASHRRGGTLGACGPCSSSPSLLACSSGGAAPWRPRRRGPPHPGQRLRGGPGDDDGGAAGGEGDGSAGGAAPPAPPGPRAHPHIVGSTVVVADGPDKSWVVHTVYAETGGNVPVWLARAGQRDNMVAFLKVLKERAAQQR